MKQKHGPKPVIVCSRHRKPFVKRPWVLPASHRHMTALVCVDCVREDRERLNKALGK